MKSNGFQRIITFNDKISGTEKKKKKKKGPIIRILIHEIVTWD